MCARLNASKTRMSLKIGNQPMKIMRAVLVLIAVLSIRVLAAATVTTELSDSETTVGVPVQLQVRVDGSANAYLPTELQIDGLDARLSGRSTQVQFDNGQMSVSGIYTYVIVPLKEGNFEIPPIEVRMGAHKQKTEPQKLVVHAGSAGTQSLPGASLPQGGTSSQGGQGNQAQPSGKIAYAELIVPKRSLYVGEEVPVEVRFYFNGHVHIQLPENPPEVTGEGFTVDKLASPQQSEEQVNGVDYNVMSFKTMLSAVKSGEMPLPQIAWQVVAMVPSGNPPQGMDDIFSQFFGSQGMPGFAEPRQIKVTTADKKIVVKPLPTAGRPADFGGAVGDFSISATAAPDKAAAGDPVTLKVAVAGRGNFDAMMPPNLESSDGWRTYPPTDKFQKGDSVGYGGTKTYEIPMVAERVQTQTPIAVLSYFDPEKEKYFTIKTQPVPVNAAGSTPAQGASVASATTSPGPTATPSPSPAAEQETGVWLKPGRPRSWEPLPHSPAFWIGHGIATFALIALLAGLAVKRSREGEAGRRATLIRERNRVLSEIAPENLPDSVFYAKAHEVLVLQAALTGAAGPVEFVRNAEAGNPAAGVLRVVLAKADEIKFSGGGGAAIRADAAERKELVKTLREVCQ